MQIRWKLLIDIEVLGEKP